MNLKETVEVHHKFKKKLKKMTLKLITVYSFDDTDDHIGTINGLILTGIDKNAPLVRTKFTRPPTPCTKDIEIKTSLN